MLLQNQCNRATEPGLSGRVCQDDARGCVRESATLDNLFDSRPDSVPEARHLSDDYDYIGRQSCNEQGDARAKVMRHLVEGFNGLRVALLGKA